MKLNTKAGLGAALALTLAGGIALAVPAHADGPEPGKYCTAATFKILKTDPDGKPLAGAVFEIDPVHENAAVIAGDNPEAAGLYSRTATGLWDMTDEWSATAQAQTVESYATGWTDQAFQADPDSAVRVGRAQAYLDATAGNAALTDALVGLSPAIPSVTADAVAGFQAAVDAKRALAERIVTSAGADTAAATELHNSATVDTTSAVDFPRSWQNLGDDYWASIVAPPTWPEATGQAQAASGLVDVTYVTTGADGTATYTVGIPGGPCIAGTTAIVTEDQAPEGYQIGDEPTQTVALPTPTTPGGDEGFLDPAWDRGVGRGPYLLAGHNASTNEVSAVRAPGQQAVFVNEAAPKPTPTPTPTPEPEPTPEPQKPVPVKPTSKPTSETTAVIHAG